MFLTCIIHQDFGQKCHKVKSVALSGFHAEILANIWVSHCLTWSHIGNKQRKTVCSGQQGVMFHCQQTADRRMPTESINSNNTNDGNAETNGQQTAASRRSAKCHC